MHFARHFAREAAVATALRRRDEVEVDARPVPRRSEAATAREAHERESV